MRWYRTEPVETDWQTDDRHGHDAMGHCTGFPVSWQTDGFYPDRFIWIPSGSRIG
ncbi:MAG: hypothetical protein NTZ78_03775 [Candidatus Aureabacteria bacterium]|nr:hypothetical protein [Candidatus Auribacterota bacterium]